MRKQLVILASASPRRKAILEGLGIEFTVFTAPVDESPVEGEDPKEYCLRLAEEKARKAAGVLPKALQFQDGLIIGADTIVVIEGTLLGKPSGPDEARRMLETLGGRTHTVITAFCVLEADTGKSVTRAVESRVTIKELSALEIKEYVSTGEPLDKAGAYAIQGTGGTLVERVEGSFTNVVGLPTKEMKEVLRDFGVKVKNFNCEAGFK